MHNGVWHVRVEDPAVAPGDVVEIPRTRGMVHRHKVDAVLLADGDAWICSIVPVTRERIEEVYGKPENR